VLPAFVGEAPKDQQAHAEKEGDKNQNDQDLDRYCHEADKSYKTFNQNN